MIEQSEKTRNIEVKIKNGYAYWFGLCDGYRRTLPNGHWVEHPHNDIKKIETGRVWTHGDWHFSTKKIDISLFTINTEELVTHVYKIIDLEGVKSDNPLVDVSQLDGLPDSIYGTPPYERLMEELGFSYQDYEWLPFRLYKSERIYKTITSPIIGQWEKLDFDIELSECNPKFSYRVAMPDALLWGREYYWAMPCVFLNSSDSYTEYLKNKMREITKHQVHVWQSRPNSNYSNELNVNFPSPTGSQTFHIPHGMKGASLHELNSKIIEWETTVCERIQQIEKDGCFDNEQIEKWISSYGLDRGHVAKKFREWLDANSEG